MVTYYDLGQNKRFEGTLIAADKAETMDVCSARCTSDKSCQVVEYEFIRRDVPAVFRGDGIPRRAAE